MPPSRPVEMNPMRFYALIDLARTLDKKIFAQWEEFLASLDRLCTSVDDEADRLSKATSALLAEAKKTTRRLDPLSPADGLEKDPLADLRHTVDAGNFLRTIGRVVALIQQADHAVARAARMVQPAEFVLSSAGTAVEVDLRDPQRILSEVQLNEGNVARFLDGLLSSAELRDAVVRVAREINDVLDGYYQALVRRHSVDGVGIHGDPISTDIAMSIYENVDAHGEIQAGKRPDEVSAYSIRKATILADAVRGGIIGECVAEPDRFIGFIVKHLRTLWKVSSDMQAAFGPLADKARRAVGLAKPKLLRESDFEQACAALADLDPRGVKFTPKTGLQSPEERRDLAFQNATLDEITARLKKREPASAIVAYILERKAELRTFYLEENSFYVCKMGAGNIMKGDPPGALKVEPGTRPVVNLDEIVGSGFDEIKGFICQVAAASRWHDLFVATSPSRTADKSNVLLVGPQGCGKSEVLRAVGGDRTSIGVFAVGSDFQTCWKGEAEKNPKRLFEECVRLQRESGKHVHILIDEIDTVLAKPEGDGFGGSGLVTEFQNLMDGVVHYSHLSVWGATNHPERIPMPMIRRFAKVLIVGELRTVDRVNLLKHFMGFLPLDDFREAHWEQFAEKTDGAVGDILRKMCDAVWRQKMTHFVDSRPEEARVIVEWLNEGDTKFNIADFTAKRREELHERLRPHVVVRPEDLRAAIESHLENQAIHHEIQTAKATYAKAKGFLASVRKTNIGKSGIEIIGGR